MFGLLLAFLGLNSHFFWTVGVVRYCRHGQPHYQCSAADANYVTLVTVLLLALLLTDVIDVQIKILENVKKRKKRGEKYKNVCKPFDKNDADIYHESNYYLRILSHM